MKELADIASSVNHLVNDIRAEVIAADLIENGLNPAEVIIIPDGSFRRKYSTDIVKAEVISSNNGQEILGIHVSRDGLYDTLPEAVFHDQSNKPLTSGHEMARFSKMQKKEEKDARLFLLPFENEIFYHRIQLEMEERKILHRFSENLFDDVYPQFWKLDRTLPKKLVSRMVLILHLATRIAGRLDLTAKCLATILDEKVAINVTTGKNRQEIPEMNSIKDARGLGSCALGHDLICGEYVADSEKVMEFVIGPLENSAVEDYLENGPYTRFLSCFYSYFIPLEVDAVTSIQVSKDQQQFTLNDLASNVILGFNARI